MLQCKMRWTKLPMMFSVEGLMFGILLLRIRALQSPSMNSCLLDTVIAIFFPICQLCFFPFSRIGSIMINHKSKVDATSYSSLF